MPRCSWTSARGRTRGQGWGVGWRGLRMLWSGDLGFAAAEPEVVAVCEAAARSFAALGAAVDEGYPQLDDPWPIVDAIWCANQAAPYAGRFDEVRERLDQGRVPVIERGLEMAATELVKAQGAKQRYAAAWDAFMAERCDLMLTPTLPVTAFAAGLDQPGSVAGRTTEYLSWTAFTYPFNVTGQPAATVPCGMRGRAAGGPADHRPAGRGRAGAARRRGLRTGAPVAVPGAVTRSVTTGHDPAPNPRRGASRPLRSGSGRFGSTRRFRCYEVRTHMCRTGAGVPRRPERCLTPRGPAARLAGLACSGGCRPGGGVRPGADRDRCGRGVTHAWARVTATADGTA